VVNKNSDVVIVSALRTPFGRYGGSLQNIDYFDLGAIPMREVLKRVNVDPNTVAEVFWGVGDTSVCKDVFTPVAARQTLIKAGLPHETASISFDMACVSAMHAVKLAALEMKAGEIDCAIAGGCTSCSREPFIARNMRFKGFHIGDVKMEDPLYNLGYKDFNPVSVDSDIVALQHRVERAEQDEWAARSHSRYGEAWKAGKFKDEIFPISIPQDKGEPKILDIDEQYRPTSTAEDLAKLKTVYNTRTITTGNASGLNDGATAILLMTREKAMDMGLKPLATIIASVHYAMNASHMPEAPGYCMLMALKKTGLSLDDMKVMEINEDFACVPLVSLRILAGGDNEKSELAKLKEKTNVNGSAIAIGHPNTASGARIIMNLMYELQRRGGGYAMGSMGGGLAQANSCIIKVD
jgi:acetyl-CoA C-acetyltransferase